MKMIGEAADEMTKRNGNAELYVFPHPILLSGRILSQEHYYQDL